MKVPCVASLLQARTVPDVIKLGRRPKRDNGNEEAGADMTKRKPNAPELEADVEITVAPPHKI